ncbi:MAG: hypothetical protein JWM10_1306 [Myxococcaceae bacterium]|nr:hypothetical protein [Myxococcaceae bacterium]
MCAAAFAVLAISPPLVARPSSSHRLESLGPPVAGRPWLLRALLTTDAPASSPLAISTPDAALEALPAPPSRGRWLRALVPPTATSIRLRVTDAAGVHRLRFATRAATPTAAAPPPDERLLVLEGTLVPELVGEVIARAPLGAIDLLPVTEQVAVTPTHAAVDACGLARFAVRVSGLGAPVSLVTPTATGERRDELRLPLAAGGVAVRDDGDSALLRATSPGATAHLVAGDAGGPTWWSAVTLGADGDEGAARVSLPPSITWIVASGGSDLSSPVSPLLRPRGAPCLDTPLGRRVARGRDAPPSLAPPLVLWDGPLASAELTSRRIQRARALCVAGLAASVALEALLLLGAGFARDPSVLQPIVGGRRNRAGVLVAGLSLLLLMGAAMILAVQLRAP